MREHRILDTHSFTAHMSVAGLRVFISQLSVAKGMSYTL